MCIIRRTYVVFWGSSDTGTRLYRVEYGIHANAEMLIIRSDGDAERTTFYCKWCVLHATLEREALRVTLQCDLYFGSLDPLDHLDDVLAA